MRYPRPETPLFASREDAAWLLLGFAAFAVAWGLAVVSLRNASSEVQLGAIAPVVMLLVAGAAILESGLRRLQLRLTGRRLSPWPLGMVSMSTVAFALTPSTIAEAAGRIGIDGRLATGLIYAVLIVDVIALTILLL